METTLAHNPQLNGCSERMNRTLVEKARTMLFDGNLPENLWGEAIMTSTYLVNRSSTICLSNKTPYDAWFGHKPDISKLRVFGTKAIVHEDGHLQKWDCRTKKPMVMVGRAVERGGSWG